MKIIWNGKTKHRPDLNLFEIQMFWRVTRAHEIIKDQHLELAERFKYECTYPKYCIKDEPFEIDRITPLSREGAKEKKNLQAI